jgi:ABC-type lipoprotein release transport system permease subunit
MNTMYFTDEPLGTIPYSVVNELQQDMRVTSVVPFAMADSYNGAGVVGTSPAFLTGKELADGRLFLEDGCFEVVVGSALARASGLSVGDQIYTSHSVGETHKTPFTVVGILRETHTVYDNEVFTQLRSIWEVHEEEEEEEHEEHDHEEMHGMVCAVLVKTKNPASAMSLVNDYDDRIYTAVDGDTFTLQAIEPMDTVRSVLDDANTTKYIVLVLCGIILVMNVIIIVIITLLNMYHSAKEISLMRLIGISMKKINLLYMIQNAFIGLVSVILAFGLSRLCLVLMRDYVATMGVVLNAWKVYPLEIVILVGVFILNILPTVICTWRMSGKESLGK